MPSSAVDRVSIVPYDVSWPRRFEAIESDLRELLQGVATRIEHVGSTAVAGLSAKPIIDVLVEVSDTDSARTFAVPILMQNGYYECYWRFDAPPGHFQCVKRDPESFKRLAHAHLAPEDHPIWTWVAFRDYLRSHNEEAARYQDLKLSLAKRFPDDREAYTAGKVDYVNDVTNRALRSRRSP